GQDTRHLSLMELGRKVGYLSQNPNDYLFQDTVEDELRFTMDNFRIKDNSICEEVLQKLNLYTLRHANPRDLSSGERQRVALASILVAEPRLLLLDEPTRGMDYRLKAELGGFLRGITAAGGSVVLVTHDVEFAAEYAARVVMIFDGMVACDGPREVLGESIFYAPQIARMFRGIAQGVLTVHEGLEKVSGGALDVCQST
ncbi:MAG: ABC transporter ATP-binding protein, partial [Thermacetogeniaceae bacterium]